MFFQPAPPTSVDWRFILGVGFTLFAIGCVLLFIAIRMMNEERDRRAGVVNREKPARDPNEPTTLQKAAQWAMGAAKIAAQSTAKAASSAASAASAASSNITRPNPPDAHETMRLLRDNLTGRLIVEISGKRYNKISDMQDANIGHAFMTTVRDLNRFTSGQPPLPGPVPPSVAPTPTVETPPPPPVAAPAPEPPLPPSLAASPAEPLRLPSMNPFKQMATLREMEKKAQPEPKTITEQIDEVLQEKIAGTALAERNLNVHAGPAGNAVFSLDGNAYDAVDDIPDATARDAIRAAIKEWEKRQ